MAVHYATQLMVGRCENPDCQSVHVDLLVENEVVCCAAISVDKIDAFIADLQENAAWIKAEKPIAMARLQ